MDNKEDIQKEFSELVPQLGKVEKKNPFNVPDYYFQGLPDKVLEHAKAQSLPWTDKLEAWLNNAFTLIFRPRYAIPAAAFMLSLIVGINFFKEAGNSREDFSQQLSEVPTQEIREYAFNHFDDDDELSALNGNVNGLIPDDVTSDELENYLNDQMDNQTVEEEVL